MKNKLKDTVLAMSVLIVANVLGSLLFKLIDKKISSNPLKELEDLDDEYDNHETYFTEGI